MAARRGLTRFLGSTLPEGLQNQNFEHAAAARRQIRCVRFALGHTAGSREEDSTDV
jgi:protein-arginine kinase activator protein McsA